MNYRNFKILAFALILFLLSSPLKAQIFKGMVIGGVNLSQMNGDQVFGYNKVGLNTGIGVMAPLNNTRNFLISMEVLYNELGAKESGDPFKYNTKIQYVSIPLLFLYEDKFGGWTFGTGLQYSRLIDVKEDWGLPNTPIKYMDSPVMSTVKDFNRDDFSFLFDIRFRIWERLKLNFRYQYSILSIRKDVTYSNSFPSDSPDYKSWQRDFYHNVLTLRLIYVINERSTKDLDRNINRQIY
ncbi:MAG: outer membrane beta-barrel protein [Bacteroidales bacterium]|nr:PorT family protein [Bacteroidales bacterium]